MRWFYDLKMRVKLLGSFVFMAIIGGIIGLVGNQEMNKLMFNQDRIVV